MPSTPQDLPDLSIIPYPPSGWKELIVVTTDAESTSSAKAFTTDDEIYVSFYFANLGLQASGPTTLAIYLDGTLVDYKNYTDVEGAHPAANPDHPEAGGFHMGSMKYTSLGRLSAGDYTITVRCDAGNTVEEADETNNETSLVIHVAQGETEPPAHLLKSSWTQIGDGPLVYKFNKYVPEDLTTGCVNTAQGQILYYWAQRGYNLSLTVNSGDSFQCSTPTLNTTVTTSRLKELCGITLEELNETLSEITYDQPDSDEDDDIAALMLAGMLINNSTVEQDGTSTNHISPNLLNRARFTFNTVTCKSSKEIPWKRIQQNIANKLVVYATISSISHALALDGYDEATGLYHANFGWGVKFTKQSYIHNDGKEYQVGNGWYTEDELSSIDALILDIMPRDFLPPVITLSASTESPTPSVTVTAAVEHASALFFSLDGGTTWEEYTEPLVVTANGTVLFKASNHVDETTESMVIANIDRDAPVLEELTVSTAAPTNQDVTVTATFTDNTGLASVEYRFDGGEWLICNAPVIMTANGLVEFRATDVAGNVSAIAPYLVANIDKEPPSPPVLAFINKPSDGVISVIVNIEDLDPIQAFFSLDGGKTWQLVSGPIDISQAASLVCKTRDAAGNESFSATHRLLPAAQGSIADESGSAQLRFDWFGDAPSHHISIRLGDGFISLDDIAENGVELYNYQGTEVQIGNFSSPDSPWPASSISVPVSPVGDGAKLVQAETNGLADIMVATPSGVWHKTYQACHTGDGLWEGLGATVPLEGLNKITDFFAGSDDATILILTDEGLGDALFVDDIYSAMPGGVSKNTSRIKAINEIIAGSGNDLVDMTSATIDSAGMDVIIRGGLGDDTIWSNNGSNRLFGDDGNDNLAGASGNDVLAGGTGDDTMHGGGGQDIFAFGDFHWGNDSVEQLQGAGDAILLWFDDVAREDVSLTASDEGFATFARASGGQITVQGVLYADIAGSYALGGDVLSAGLSLKFGDDGSDIYKTLLADGAFNGATSATAFKPLA